MVEAINPNYLGLTLCLHYTRELCADRKILPDSASFCSHLRMIKNVCGGAISMTAGAKTMISKVERHISDRFFCHTYRPLERSDTEVLISYGLLVMY